MKKKLRAENDFVKFDTPLLPKPLFFRKAKSSAAAPAGSPAAQVRMRGFLGASPVCGAGWPCGGPGRPEGSLGEGPSAVVGTRTPRPRTGCRIVEFVGVGRSGDAPVNQDLEGEEGPPRSRGGRLGRRRSGRCHHGGGVGCALAVGVWCLRWPCREPHRCRRVDILRKK